MPIATQKQQKTPFAPAAVKFTIGSLDHPEVTVSAQYNPAEVQIAQGVTWSPHPKKAGDDQALQFESGAQQPRKYTVELLFDGAETVGVLGGKTGATTIEEQIGKLQKLVDHQTPYPGAKTKRPHFCVAVWGRHGVPAMSCVIENLQTKYQRLSPTGRVERATVTLSLMEAYRVDLEKTAPLVKSQAYLMARSKVERAAVPDSATRDYNRWRSQQIYDAQQTELKRAQQAPAPPPAAAPVSPPPPPASTPVKAPMTEAERGAYVRQQLAEDEAAEPDAVSGAGAAQRAPMTEAERGAYVREQLQENEAEDRAADQAAKDQRAKDAAKLAE